MHTAGSLSEEEVMHVGLKWAGFDINRHVRFDTKNERFRSFYGSGPSAVAAVYSDLLKEDSKLKIKDLFMALYLLKAYPTECILAGTFKNCETTVGTICWRTIKKIQSLKDKKVSVLLVLLLYAFIGF